MNEHTHKFRNSFQVRVLDWMLYTFGADVARDIKERCHRFFEEALELVQALGCTVKEAHQLVDYVFGRPVGEPAQELGGAQVCLAALAQAARFDLEDASEKELARNWTNAEKIREKWKNKPKFSPLPQHVEVVDREYYQGVIAELRSEIALMKPVIEAGDDLYASLAECDDNELSKFQKVSRDTYAAVSNAYRAPSIAINEEAHGH